jgi:transcriptional regulator with XRE-family HTH domain
MIKCQQTYRMPRNLSTYFEPPYKKMVISPAQCRAARALLDWSQERLSAESKVGIKTIVDFEQGNRKPYDRTIRDLREALEAAGVEFTNDNRPGLRLRAGSG